MVSIAQQHTKLLLDINNSVIDGKWKVIKRIGEGSFESIYYEVIEQKNSAKVYTLKVRLNLK